LPELTGGADLVVYPSQYEGFGLGVLEAMASAVPVACANAASLPETAGDAALYFDPVSVEEIAQSMIKLASDKDFAKQKIAQGLERVKLFSWDKCAQQVICLMQDAAAK
jgi:glycosyltransferase involved in cell wall biosynthesis